MHILQLIVRHSQLVYCARGTFLTHVRTLINLNEWSSVQIGSTSMSCVTGQFVQDIKGIKLSARKL